MKFISRFIILIVVIAGCYLLLKKVVIPPLKNIFSSKPVVIDETPILIKQIRSIGQLITYSSFDEVVVDSVIATKGSAFVNAFNRFAPLPVLPPADKELVLIGRGKVMAGTDLAKLTDSSITIQNDTVRLYMPPVQILDAILNPSDFETFVEKGDWSSQDVALVKAKARRKMIDEALRQNLLPKADAKARSIMENFLRNVGYQNVLIL